MRVNWKKYRASIPNRVQIGKTTYEIVWVADFADGKTLGETRYEQKQIALKTGDTDRNTVSTYLHEIGHATAHEEGAGMTENQISRIENAVPYLLKPGNIFNL